MGNYNINEELRGYLFEVANFEDVGVVKRNLVKKIRNIYLLD